MLIFEAYRVRVEAEVGVGPKGGAFAALSAWCEERNLDPESMLDLASLRESALEEMVAASLNPFWGVEHRLFETPGDRFLRQVQRLKRCLYDAYRLNALVWDAKISEYVNRFGLAVAADPPLESGAHERAGKVLITPVVSVVTDGFKRLRWKLASPMVSVLDTGYPETSVGYDPSLVEPAAASAAET